MLSWPDSEEFHLLLPPPVPRIYDEYGNYCGSSSFIAYTYEELKFGRFNYA